MIFVDGADELERILAAIKGIYIRSLDVYKYDQIFRM